jgi:6-phosphogluconate dehydrogenase (decarboxylating)
MHKRETLIQTWGSSTQRGADHFTKLCHQGVTQGVHHALSIPVALDNPGMDQETQVFGNIGLGGSGAGHNVADVPGAMTNGLEDAQAHGFAEGFKEGGDGFELLWGELLRGRVLTHVFVVIYS